jgi:DNA-binding beta-propeller fold protein YncE
MGLAALPATQARRNRVVSYLATAALLLLTLAAGYLAVGPDRGDMGDDSSIRLAAVSTPVADSTPAPGAPVAFVWQTTGGPNRPLSEPGRLSGAGLLAIDPQGNLWVTDAQAHQFQVFTPDGTFLEAWGTPGSGDGELNLIASGYSYGGAAFDADGNLYVADTGNHRIQKFGPHRSFITAWGSQGADDGQFLRPLSVAVDDRGRVFVSDDLRSDVQVFDRDGAYLATWGGKDAGAGRLNGPSGITFDAVGNVWIADFNSNRVLQFSPEGEFLTAWGEYGSDEGELFEPQALAVDDHGRVYVTEFGNYRVQVFDGEGQVLATWGESGNGEGQFDGVYGIVLDGAGHVYVSELIGKRVQKFRLLPPLAP